MALLSRSRSESWAPRTSGSFCFRSMKICHNRLRAHKLAPGSVVARVSDFIDSLGLLLELFPYYSGCSATQAPTGLADEVPRVQGALQGLCPSSRFSPHGKPPPKKAKALNPKP